MTKPVARDAIYRRRRFQAEDIEQCVRWYITYRPSYRDLVAMMAERGVHVSHTGSCVTCRSPRSIGRVTSDLRSPPGGWTKLQFQFEESASIFIARSRGVEVIKNDAYYKDESKKVDSSKEPVSTEWANEAC
jgi:hypothetical protein